MSPDIVMLERRIKATPDTVYSFFTDRDRWLSWRGVQAEIDPRPGGVFRMNVRGDGRAAGRFVTVDPRGPPAATPAQTRPPPEAGSAWRKRLATVSEVRHQIDFRR